MRLRSIVVGIAASGLLLAGCGSSSQPIASSSAAVPAGSVLMAPAAISVDTVKAWPVQWCMVQPGMKQAQIEALMGPPTETFGVDNGGPSLRWGAFQYQFNAFFDVDGKARQLDVNQARLTATEKTSIRCGVTRMAK